jgi:Caspase domain
MTEQALPDRSRSRAVLIGTSRYVHLTQVPAAANSLESMRRLLTGPLCGWPDDRVVVISNRQAPGDLPDLLVELLADAEDTAFFFYVGHGRVDFEDQLCLGLVGSRDESERRATTSLTFDAVRRAMRASQAATKVVILDCCFAGHAVHTRHTLSGGEDIDITGLVGASGAYTLAATGPASTAWFEADTDSPLPHTHFTRALIEAVTRGIPGEPAALTLEPVYRRVREVMQVSGRPIPTRNSRDLAGDFIFARNVAPRPARKSSAASAPGGNLTRASRLIDAAEDAARAIPDPDAQCGALVHIAQVVSAGAGSPHRAHGLLDQAERIIPGLPDRKTKAACLRQLADAVVADDPVRARGLLDKFENVMKSNEISQNARDWDLAIGLAQQSALLRLDPDRVDRLACTIASGHMRSLFVARAAEAIAQRDPSRAVRLANGASDADGRDKALEEVVSAIVDDDPDSAERIARSIADHGYQASALATVAAAAGPRDPQHGLALLHEAEAAAKRAPDASRLADRLMHVVFALTLQPRLEHARQESPGIGWIREHAARITDQITLPHYSARSAIATAKTMLPDKPGEACKLLDFAVRQYREIAATEDDQAKRYWDKHTSAYILRDAALAMLPADKGRALSIAASTPHGPPYELRDQVYTVFVPELASHDPILAERLAHSIVEFRQRATALASIARTLAGNDPAEAAALLEHARRIARAADARAVPDIAAVVATYDPQLATTIFNQDAASGDRSEGLARIAEAAAEASIDSAEDIARTIPDPADRIRALSHLAALLAVPTEAEPKPA